MNYKELIQRLKSQGSITFNTYTVGRDCKDAADVIETLLAERDAAVEDLRGICWCCAHGEKWGKAPKWSKMTTCEHMREQGARAISGGKRKCEHWKWRGPKKEE